MSGDLLLPDVDETYRDAILEASRRTGMAPQAIAAVIDAEAAKGANGAWLADSESGTSDAMGLTQFLSSTWLERANTPGTALNEATRGMSNAAILALRTDPRLSIITAAEYDSGGLQYLKDRGLSDPELDDAQLAYLAHHEGWGGASTILRGQMDPDMARAELRANDPSDLDAADPVKAYHDWLWGYIKAHIRTDKFTAPASSAPAPPATPPSGDPVQTGEPTVVLGPDQLPAAHAGSPHVGGAIAQGSGSVVVGKDQRPFARKGDATTDGGFVWGNTQPDVVVGG